MEESKNIWQTLLSSEVWPKLLFAVTAGFFGTGFTSQGAANSAEDLLVPGIVLLGGAMNEFVRTFRAIDETRHKEDRTELTLEERSRLYGVIAQLRRQLEETMGIPEKWRRRQAEKLKNVEKLVRLTDATPEQWEEIRAYIVYLEKTYIEEIAPRLAKILLGDAMTEFVRTFRAIDETRHKENRTELTLEERGRLYDVIARLRRQWEEALRMGISEWSGKYANLRDVEKLVRLTDATPEQWEEIRANIDSLEKTYIEEIAPRLAKISDESEVPRA